MSTSTVSINPNPTLSTRRRPVDKKSTPQNDPVLATPPQPTFPDHNTITTTTTTNNSSLRFDNRDPIVNKPVPSSLTTTINPNPNPNRRLVKKVTKAPKPKWLTAIRVLTKNLVLLCVLGGLVQIVRKLSEKREIVGVSDGVVVISADLDGKFAAMDEFVKKSAKMMQVQVDLLDRKLTKEIRGVKEEMERRDVKVVEREIEKHASDGLGRVDYALGSGGARVVKHSEVYLARRFGGLNLILERHSVHPDAAKMLMPSFGEPGMCFPLRGSSGYVIIRLRTAVVPEAITLEHVAKSVAYDRSSAPKDCRVSGWRAQTEDSTDLAAENEKMLLLSEFTYDLEKSNAQTFNVLDSVGSSLVDTIRFDFASNHGSSSHTCIYRLRVHGYEPSPSMLAAGP